MDAKELIKKMMNDQDVSSVELSSMLGRTPGYISATLGRGSCPRLDTFVGIARALGYKVQIVDKDSVITEVE